jgi:hypothetical protein
MASKSELTAAMDFKKRTHNLGPLRAAALEWKRCHHLWQLKKTCTSSIDGIVTRSESAYILFRPRVGQVTTRYDTREAVPAYERGRDVLEKGCVLLAVVEKKWKGLDETRNDLRGSRNVKASRETKD